MSATWAAPLSPSLRHRSPDRCSARRMPYGYRRNAEHAGVKLDPERDAKALVPDEAAAPIVRRIFAMRLDGHKWAAIVRALNEAGVPSPRDGFWTHNTVSTIVGTRSTRAS